MADVRLRLALASLVVLLGLLAGSGKVSAGPEVCNGKTATITGSGTINGTAGDDVIVGSEGSDRIWGRGGNDVICSLGGSDRIEGGPGDDWIYTGGGDNVALGQGDNDVLIGDVGSDDLKGGPGADLLLGRSGDDFVAGGSGNDEIYGEQGDDQLFGGAGNDLLNGGPGEDRVVGDRGHDRLEGGADSDRIEGGSGHDTLRGGAGHDVLQGGQGADQIWGGAGHDVLEGGQGADQIRGDAGNDWIYGDTNDELNGGAGQDTCEPAAGARIVACEAGFVPGRDVQAEHDALPEPADLDEVNLAADAEILPQPADLGPGDLDSQDLDVDAENLARPDGASWLRPGMPLPEANEAELWVSPSGIDGNPGTESEPLRSIQVAVDRASPGTTIYLMDGQWRGQGRSGIGWVTFGVENSGEPGRWIRLTAAPGAKPHLIIRQGEAIRVEGAYIEISGLRIEGIDGGPGDPDSVNGPNYGYGILIPHVSADGETTPAHHVVVADNEVSGFSISGIATDGANWIVVGGNIVHGNSNWSNFGGSGISFLEHSDAGGGGEGETTGWITNNRVFDNRQLVDSSSIGFDHITDGNCIILDRMDLGAGQGQRTIISENTVSGCGGRGVNIFESSNVDVRRNLTFHNGQTPRLSGEMYGGGDNIVWIQNTMVPRPGRQDLIGQGEDDDNRVLDPSITLAAARDQHRSRTGARTP